MQDQVSDKLSQYKNKIESKIQEIQDEVEQDIEELSEELDALEKEEAEVAAEAQTIDEDEEIKE
jgi:polyhydroxyalkanoate synthesis regulator phasin